MADFINDLYGRFYNQKVLKNVFFFSERIAMTKCESSFTQETEIFIFKFTLFNFVANI